MSLRDWNALIAFSETADPNAPVEETPEPLSVAAIMPPPPPPSVPDGFESWHDFTEYEEELRVQTRRLKATREAKRKLDEEERASGETVITRAVPLGTAVLGQPDETPACWGEGNRVAWAEGQTMMIAAPQGLGKSTFAQQLLLRRIGLIEEPLLGMPVKAGDSAGRALYLGMDRPPQILSSFKRMFSPEDEAYVNEHAVFWPGGIPSGVLADPASVVEWVFEIAPGCHTVVFDSVKDIMTGVSKDEVGGQINAIWQELLVNGVEVLALHHHRKNGQGLSKVHSLDEIYGSTWLTSGAGTVFSIDGKPGDALVTFKQLKSAAEMLEEIEARHDFEHGTVSLYDEPQRTVSGVLGDAGASGVTVEEIAQAVHHQVTNATKQRIRKELKKLKESGLADTLPRPSRTEPELWVKTAGTATGNKYADALSSL